MLKIYCEICLGADLIIISIITALVNWFYNLFMHTTNYQSKNYFDGCAGFDGKGGYHGKGGHGGDQIIISPKRL